uniref:(northern house mosquito) hypothetical protein n=1 Tax=Culex pipiens TaxID=7175 RepID=A0A8D8CK09_CULPI
MIDILNIEKMLVLSYDLFSLNQLYYQIQSIIFAFLFVCHRQDPTIWSNNKINKFLLPKCCLSLKGKKKLSAQIGLSHRFPSRVSIHPEKWKISRKHREETCHQQN